MHCSLLFFLIKEKPHCSFQKLLCLSVFKTAVSFTGYYKDSTSNQWGTLQKRESIVYWKLKQSRWYLFIQVNFLDSCRVEPTALYQVKETYLYRSRWFISRREPAGIKQKQPKVDSTKHFYYSFIASLTSFDKHLNNSNFQNNYPLYE